MTTKDAITIANEADAIIRDRYCDAYEVCYDGETDTYFVARPRNAEEGGEPYQPTAVCVCSADDVDDAEQLYNEALRYVDEVDRLAETTEEW